MRKYWFKKEFQTAFRVLMLDKHAVSELSRDDQKTFMALVFLAVPVLANLILASVTVGHFSYFHLQALLGGLIISVLAIFVASYVAEKGFHGTAAHMGFFRVIGYSSFVGWLNIITYLFFLFGIPGLSGFRSTVSFIIGIWMIVVFYKSLRYVHNLKDGDAVLTMVATIIGILIIQGIFVRFFSFTGGVIF